jgi:flagellar hook-length control protein FliK
MLAQSSNAVLPTALHDPGGAKKARGIAGLFSDILSQAQKNLGKKASEPAKAAERGGDPKPVEARLGLDPKLLRKGSEQPAEGPQGIRERPVRGEAARAASRPATAETSVPAAKGPVLEEAKAGVKPDEAKAASAYLRDRRGPSQPTASSDQEQVASRAVEEGRRVKAKREPASEEALALAAGVNAKPAPSSALSPKPKAPANGVDADSSIEKKVERPAPEPKLSVLDLRRGSEAKREAALKAEAKPDDTAKDSIREAKAPGSDAGREVFRELSLDRGGSGESPAAAKAESSAGRGQDFQSMMAERMREAWNGEIVQSAHIVLRDGDAGTIRLRLRPESLGNVKIELNLSENNISGRIIVESDEAKSAFERNMGELADAFKQGGFDSARLEVSVGGNASGGAGGGRGDASTMPFFSERMRGALGSAADPATAASAYSRRGSAVDILA